MNCRLVNILKGLVSGIFAYFTSIAASYALAYFRPNSFAISAALFLIAILITVLTTLFLILSKCDSIKTGLVRGAVSVAALIICFHVNVRLGTWVYLEEFLSPSSLSQNVQGLIMLCILAIYIISLIIALFVQVIRVKFPD